MESFGKDANLLVELERYSCITLRCIVCCQRNADLLYHVFTGPQDDTVTGLCSHVYHRACIMDWLQLGHDECPNCRQPMWDSETYRMVDQSIRGQHPTARHPAPSAPLEVGINIGGVFSTQLPFE